MQDVIYFHGGPGLNGAPERAALIEPFAARGFRLHVWDEPSKLRPNGDPFHSERAYPGWVESALRFAERRTPGGAILMGLSFGAWAVWEIARQKPSLCRQAVYVNPGLCPPLDQESILPAARDDFATRGDRERKEALDEVLSRYDRERFDANTQRGWEVALESPALFDLYWVNEAAKQAYFAALQGEHAIDVDSFIAVSRDRPPLPEGTSEVPAHLLWGERDAIVVRPAGEAALAARHPRLSRTVLEGTAHYPPLEDPTGFLDWLERTCR